MSLSVGGDLSYANGQVFQGDVEAGGDIANPGPGGFNVLNGTYTANVAGVFDAGDSETDMEDIAAHLSGLTANGTITEGYGQVTLTGTDSDLNVFDLNLDDIKDGWANDPRYASHSPSAVNALTIDAPAGSTVVVNVSGDTTVFLKAHGIFLKGVTGDTVVWNFDDDTLTKLHISASPVHGTVLAPHSEVEFKNTQMHGQLIAAKVTGNGELHELSFGGDICDEEEETETDSGTTSDSGTSSDSGSSDSGKPN